MAVAAVLDACVLYPIGLRDTLLNVAEAGFFRVLWTEEILAETSRSIVEDVPGLTPERLQNPKDRHVLAAAVEAGADLIVTHNLRHFPPEACGPHDIRVRSPDDFLVEAIE